MARNPSPRERTREDILDAIRTAGELTRSELTESMGLARSTVNNAVARLLADGSVIESEVETKGPGSGSGRPGTKLRPAPSGTYVAGIDFGHCHVHVAVADGGGAILDEQRVDLAVDLRAVQALDVAAEIIGKLQAGHGIERIDAVVAGVPGPLDVGSGLVCSATILSGWVGLAPAEELTRRVGVPVRVENDAFLGAYGELRHGAGRGSSDFVFVKASNGIGACPVINGSPYHGATGIAGEIGHTHVPGRTELCRCGQRGCLEAVVSIETVRRSIAHAHPGMDVDGVALAALDDPMTRRILDEAGRTLGRVLADVCNVLNPASIVLGGDLGTGGPPLLEGVQSSVRRYATPAVAAATQVLPATLGTRAELIGAVALAASLASRPAR